MKKYSGSGNTFLILFASELNGSIQEFIAQYGQETDGVIFASRSSRGFEMDFYNRDGTQADFCGNGSRCFLRFLYDNQLISLGGEILIYTGCGQVHGQLIQEDWGMIEMPEPSRIILREASGYTGFYLTVGVPHFVIFLDTLDQLENLDIVQIGSLVRNNPVFPTGANVNFVFALSPDELRVRTFERGVEGETKACGSGSTASAYVHSSLSKPSRENISIFTNGGILQISFRNQKIYCSGGIQHV